VAAILAAAAFLGRWLEEENGFPKIFAATGLFFGLAAVVPPWLDEPNDDVLLHDAVPRRGWSWARVGDWGADQVALVRGDPALARLTLVAACFAAVLILFPHYQAFARDRLGTPIRSLLTWVLVQNASTGLASLVAGPISDRRGTRVVLVWLVALSALTPLLVLVLGFLPQGMAASRFWLVYVPLGLNPISLKIFTHYALELAPGPREHPRYVSIVGVALALPFLLSPLVGLAVDTVGFAGVFVAGFVAIATGAVVALGLPEPRHRDEAPAGQVPVGGEAPGPAGNAGRAADPD
jgi:MFS family permease